MRKTEKDEIMRYSFSRSVLKSVKMWFDDPTHWAEYEAWHIKKYGRVPTSGYGCPYNSAFDEIQSGDIMEYLDEDPQEDQQGQILCGHE